MAKRKKSKEKKRKTLTKLLSENTHRLLSFFIVLQFFLFCSIFYANIWYFFLSLVSTCSNNPISHSHANTVVVNAAADG